MRGEGPLQAGEARVGAACGSGRRRRRPRSAQHDEPRRAASGINRAIGGGLIVGRLRVARGCSAVDGLEEDFLRALEAGRDLERGERFALRVGGAAGEEIALGEIAMRGGAIRRADGQRHLELAQRHRGVLGAHRGAAEAGMAADVERIQLDEPRVRERERLLVVGLRGEIRQAARGLDGGTVVARAACGTRRSPAPDP